QDAGMGLLPWSPLGGGWLTGKYKRDEMPTGATRLGENPNRGGESYAPRNALERTWAIIGVVEEIAKAHGVSMAQVALGWTAAQPAITSVILGARTPEQLADNLGAMKLKLSDDDMARLNEVSAPQPLDYPYGKGGINQRHRKIEGGR
ncbi:aldo/keto reductase, partial [Rhizobium ruizarguesonis]